MARSAALQVLLALLPRALRRAQKAQIYACSLSNLYTHAGSRPAPFQWLLSVQIPFARIAGIQNGRLYLFRNQARVSPRESFPA